MPLELAIPPGCCEDREFSNSLADSTVEAQTTTILAFTCCSLRVWVSTNETPVANPSLSTRISRASAFSRKVKLPVARALGNMEPGVLKIAPISHPSMQCPQ